MTKKRLPAALRATRLALACALGVASPTLAQQAALFGRRDFELEWRLSPSNTLLSVRYLAARGVLRFEPLDGSSRALIRTLATGEAVLLIGQGQRGAFTLRMPPMGAFNPAQGGGTQKVGTEECREFTTGSAMLCLSDDGIPLAARFEEGGFTATRLLRQPQAPALFEVPAGIKPKPMPPGEALGLVPF